MIKKGVLLVNLGTPKDSSIKEIRAFLGEFLDDRRVLSIPTVFRKLLLNLIILPFRPKKIQKEYSEVITEEGSPLLLITTSLTNKIRPQLPENVTLGFAMRYRFPAIREELDKMIKHGVDSILIIPMFPQYASATTGSVYEEVFRSIEKRYHIPTIKFINSFYEDDFFINAQVKLAEPFFKKDYDHVVFSFHGVPLTHLTKQADSIKGYCKSKEKCCETMCDANRYCYGAQCTATAQAIASKLSIPYEKYTVCYQSRFGPAEWTQPYTSEVVTQLAKEGKKRVIAFCAAFTADCLETLEEIAEGEKENFLEHGGESFETVPCVNDTDLFASGLAEKIKTDLGHN